MVANLDLLGTSGGKEKYDARLPGALRFCAFLLIITLAAVLYEYYLLDGLYEKRSKADVDLRTVETAARELDAKLNGVDARLCDAEKVLDFMLTDVRAGEVLSVLSAAAAEGLFVERLEITTEGLTLFGGAKSKSGISGLHKALVMSGLFPFVSKPDAVSGTAPDLKFYFQCRRAEDVPGEETTDG